MESYQKELASIKSILKESPRGMTVTDISRKMKINRNSVAKYMDILLISGHVEMVTFGPAKVFFPSRRIPISTMLNFTSDFMILLDKELKVVQVNEKFLSLMDIERESILGNRINDSSKAFFKNPEVLTNIKIALDGKESTIETSFLNGPDELYFKIKHIPTTFDDGEPGVILIIEDTTKQKRTERKLTQAVKEWETTFNSITDMISIHDKDFNIVKVNKAFAEFLQDKSEKFIGKKCYEIIHGTKKSHPNCPCQKIQLIKKSSIVEFFEPHLGKHLEVSASPIINEEGEISGSIHIIKDITERKNS
ncbi:MAG: PAS domain-containing protein [Thermoplasmatales archaeon]|nr:PAS domain-containing protein [Thermoplasmatales archaeon]